VKSLKGIVLTQFGDPAKVLELKTLPDPPPPGLGEVVVRVTKRVIHPGNLVMIRGGFDMGHAGRSGAVVISSAS
jgi:NADPH2:quinone reductase